MKYLLLFLFPIFIFSNVIAQGDYDDETPDVEEEEEFVGFSKKKNKEKKDLSRWKIGGDFGFFANEIYLNTEISPLVGYEVIDDRIEFGGGIVYQYTNIKRAFVSFPSGNTFIPAKINVVGGRVYGRVFVFQGAFIQIEGLLINYRERTKDVNSSLVKLTISNALAGVGYRLDIAEKIHTIFSLSTNLVINPLYPQRTLIPRIGFQVSL